MSLSSKPRDPRASVPDAPTADLSYDEVARRTRELVEGLTPIGATIVVVSKGDDRLVRFEGRAGWHFPRAANGQYAGFHPSDGAWAVEHVETLRAEGGAYFVLPASYLWWFEHYPELAQHLRTRYEVVADDEDVCHIYRLLDVPAMPARVEPDLLQGPGRKPAVHAMRALVGNLLPEDEVVLVVSDGDDSLLELGQQAWHFPHDATGAHVPLDPNDDENFVTQIDALRQGGTRYLLVPSSAFSTLARCAKLSAYLGKCRVLAVRARACALFELTVPADLPRSNGFGVESDGSTDNGLAARRFERSQRGVLATALRERSAAIARPRPTQLTGRTLENGEGDS